MYFLLFQVLLTSKEINPVELDFLLRFPVIPNLTSPVDFLSNNGWGGIKALSNMDEFRNLDRDIEGSAKRWKKFVESECPEKEKFPQEWKNKTVAAEAVHDARAPTRQDVLRRHVSFFCRNVFCDVTL